MWKKLVLLLLGLLNILSLTASETNKVVRYEDFGAAGDGKTNDAQAIYKAHQYANKHRLPVRAKDDAHYYIGEMEKVIMIGTDTDFGKARFTIDDRKLTRNSDKPVFSVVTERKYSGINIRKNVSSLQKGQSKLDIKLPYPAMINVRSDQSRHFIRYGNNANNGSWIQDVFLVDEDGNVDPTTPILWDFEKIRSITALPIPAEKRVIRGGVFTTLANAEKGPHKYYSRNIRINRSNTVLENITHLVKEPKSRQSFPYAGFISIGGCANVLVKDCVFTGHKVYHCIKPNSPSTTTGTYDISLHAAINVTFLNCRQSNDIYDNTWGIMGSNRCKNLVYDNCRLSRFDAHQGVCNATIRNSEVGKSGIHVTGFGTLLVENCVFRRNRLVNLRIDYGSFWDGDIIIRNSVWHIGARETRPTVLTGKNSGKHYFGYQCRMPRTIKIENLLVKDGKCTKRYKGIALLGDFGCQYGAPGVDHPIEPTEKIIISNLKTESGKGCYLSPVPQAYKKVKVIRESAVSAR